MKTKFMVCMVLDNVAYPIQGDFATLKGAVNSSEVLRILKSYPVIIVRYPVISIVYASDLREEIDLSLTYSYILLA